MGKSSPPPAPAPPDPSKATSIQTAGDIQTAIAQGWIGNPNTFGPYGSQTNTVANYIPIKIPDGEGGFIEFNIPQFNQTTTLSPEQQALLNQQQKIGGGMNDLALSQIGRLTDVLGRPIGAGNLPPNFTSAPTNPQLKDPFGINRPGFDRAEGMGVLKNTPGYVAPASSRDEIEQALLSRINPQLEQDRDALETKLINEGFQRGTSAFNDAMDAFNRQSTDARYQATVLGGQEEQRQIQNAIANYNASLSGTAFNNQNLKDQYEAYLRQLGYNNPLSQQEFENLLNVFGQSNTVAQNQWQNANTQVSLQQSLRQQALQEELALRNQPINEITALASGGQVNMPQFQQWNAPQIQPYSYAQNAYNSAKLANDQWATQYAMQTQQNNALTGGLFGLAGMGLYGLGKGGLFSDIRLKEDISLIGTLGPLNLYRFRFIGQPEYHIGVMAHEAAEIYPEAVSMHSSGYLMVDYGKLH